MGEFRLLLPKMGESVIEATILTWHKKEGDTIYENEILLEVATDKVDSDVPSPVSGIIQQRLHHEGEVVAIGTPLAIIHTETETLQSIPKSSPDSFPEQTQVTANKAPHQQQTISSAEENPSASSHNKVLTEQAVPPLTLTLTTPNIAQGGKYFSPLVLNIAHIEGVTMKELDNIAGSGLDNRVTKEDILSYVASKKSGNISTLPLQHRSENTLENTEKLPEQKEPLVSIPIIPADTEIIAMDRMRKLIAKNMVDSKRISAHVSSFVEADVTNIVLWRNTHKEGFKKQEGFNLTFMPVFVEAIARAIKDFPMINVSVDGENIIKKKSINIGIATALPSGNLIVPVIKNADKLSLTGLAAAINDLAARARTNKLSTADIDGGTYTISNIGTFGNILGTPIIPQPQVAIMAVGAIVKKPVVIETPQGDMIGIRHRMYLSHTYDHRVVDGALGGMFVKRVAEYLEAFDIDRAM